MTTNTQVSDAIRATLEYRMSLPGGVSQALQAALPVAEAMERSHPAFLQLLEAVKRREWQTAPILRGRVQRRCPECIGPKKDGHFGDCHIGTAIAAAEAALKGAE